MLRTAMSIAEDTCFSLRGAVLHNPSLTTSSTHTIEV
jgi:hypothetical protein